MVYRLKSENALSASTPDSLYLPAWSVRMRVQLFIAATSPAISKVSHWCIQGTDETWIGTGSGRVADDSRIYLDLMMMGSNGNGNSTAREGSIQTPRRS